MGRREQCRDRVHVSNTRRARVSRSAFSGGPNLRDAESIQTRTASSARSKRGLPDLGSPPIPLPAPAVTVVVLVEDDGLCRQPARYVERERCVVRFTEQVVLQRRRGGKQDERAATDASGDSQVNPTGFEQRSRRTVGRPRAWPRQSPPASLRTRAGSEPTGVELSPGWTTIQGLGSLQDRGEQTDGGCPCDDDPSSGNEITGKGGRILRAATMSGPATTTVEPTGSSARPSEEVSCTTWSPLRVSSWLNAASPSEVGEKLDESGPCRRATFCEHARQLDQSSSQDHRCHDHERHPPTCRQEPPTRPDSDEIRNCRGARRMLSPLGLPTRVLPGPPRVLAEFICLRRQVLSACTSRFRDGLEGHLAPARQRLGSLLLGSLFASVDDRLQVRRRASRRWRTSGSLKARGRSAVGPRFTAPNRSSRATPARNLSLTAHCRSPSSSARRAIASSSSGSSSSCRLVRPSTWWLGKALLLMTILPMSTPATTTAASTNMGHQSPNTLESGPET